MSAFAADTAELYKFPLFLFLLVVLTYLLPFLHLMALCLLFTHILLIVIAVAFFFHLVQRVVHSFTDAAVNTPFAVCGEGLSSWSGGYIGEEMQ